MKVHVIIKHQPTVNAQGREHEVKQTISEASVQLALASVLEADVIPSNHTITSISAFKLGD